MKRIKQISVEKLFGLFDHIIPFNLNERITIMHGPNGIGKTAILRLLKSLFNGNHLALRKLPFNEFRVVFEDGTNFWVTKTYDGIGASTNYKITFHTDGTPEFSLPSKPTSPVQLSLIDHLIPMLDRIGLESWRLPSTGEILSLEDVLERFGEQLSPDIVYEKEPKWFTEIKKNIPIRFIETQRLLNTRNPSRRNVREYSMPPSITPTVNMYAEELAETIKTKLAESSALSQSLDRTFPRRVVDPAIKKRRIAESQLRDKLAILEKKRSDLMETGLLDQNSDPVQVDQIDESTNIVLSIYVEDTEQKLGIFDELANKIELLKRIINKRFLYKKMAISRQDGFVFTTRNGTNLPLDSLSSGEQHELVLFYELLFKVDPGSLILIDEPEISLHMGWQQQFLEDIQEVTPLTNIDILMATHSPDIINNRWDLTVPLEGPH